MADLRGLVADHGLNVSAPCLDNVCKVVVGPLQDQTVMHALLDAAKKQRVLVLVADDQSYDLGIEVTLRARSRTVKVIWLARVISNGAGQVVLGISVILVLLSPVFIRIWAYQSRKSALPS